MKAIVIGEGSGTTMETIMSVYPRHKINADKYIQRGDVIGIGPFADKSGNMAIFKRADLTDLHYITQRLLSLKRIFHIWWGKMNL